MSNLGKFLRELLADPRYAAPGRLQLLETKVTAENIDALIAGARLKA
jgi:hypothetical protein